MSNSGKKSHENRPFGRSERLLQEQKCCFGEADVGARSTASVGATKGDQTASQPLEKTGGNRDCKGRSKKAARNEKPQTAGVLEALPMHAASLAAGSRPC
jgi:hypothetical protein